MRIIFLGYDTSIETLNYLEKEGHSIIGIFSSKEDNIFSFNHNLRRLAKERKIPFSIKPITSSQINKMIKKECDCFVSIGYPHKIPDINSDKSYGINIHPTLLPEGRGPMPIPRLIMQYPEYSGITIHKISSSFDRGDILYQEPIKLMPNESSDTLASKIIMRTPKIVNYVLQNINELWTNAQVQKKAGSWWEPYSEKERTIHWNQSVDEINLIARAFSRYGLFVHINRKKSKVFNITVWQEKHNFKTGKIMNNFKKNCFTVAISNGYVIVKDIHSI